MNQAADQERLWKVYVYTARSYCNDINTLREVERRFLKKFCVIINILYRYALKEDPGQALENGLNTKRRFEDLANTNNEDEYETRKQVKIQMFHKCIVEILTIIDIFVEMIVCKRGKVIMSRIRTVVCLYEKSSIIE